VLPILPLLLALTIATPSQLPPHLQLRLEVTQKALRCPSEPRVIRQLAREMESVPMYLPEKRRVLIRVARRGRQLEAAITIMNSAGRVVGQRTLQSPKRSCRRLLESAVLSLAVALQQTDRAPRIYWRRPASDLTSARTRAGPAGYRPRRLPDGPVVGTSRDVPGPPARIQVSVSGVVAVGPLPDLSFGGRVGLEFRWDRFSVAIEAHVDHASSEVADRQASKTRAFAAAVPCAHWRFLALCGVLGGGLVHVSFDDVAQDRPTFLGGARLAGEWTLAPRILLRAFVEGTGQTPRVQLIRQGQVVHEPPPASVSIGAALVSYF
jgi:hypothetical protein